MGNRSCLVAAFLFSAMPAAARGAGDDVRQLQFIWPKPTPATPCELRESERPAASTKRRFRGTVDFQDERPVCSVQIARPRFNDLYGFCGVAYGGNQAREFYGCWVHYFPRYVSFSYSYSSESDSGAAPACAFVCTRK